MVDFQSRDTNRGYGSDEEDETDDDEQDPADDAESEAEPEAESEGATEPAEQERQEAEVPDDDQPVATDPAQEHDGARVEQDPSDAAAAPGEQAASTPAETTGTEPQTGADATAAVEAVAYAVVTITNERSLSDDDQGDAVVEAIEGAGDRVLTRDLVQPGYDNVQSTVSTLAERSDIDIAVTVGGTGVEPSDVTAEAIKPLFEKQLPGFGELFRLLAHETEGTAVVGTRATAGIIDQTPVFALPGTVRGVQLGMGEIVIPEGRHLAADAAADK
jgi:molybdenum cofactor biosynthesis protein B